MKNKNINTNTNIFRNLPNDIINYILLYDDHFILRKGKIISIIPKTDERYKKLLSIPKKKNTYGCDISVYIPVNINKDLNITYSKLKNDIITSAYLANKSIGEFKNNNNGL